MPVETGNEKLIAVIGDEVIFVLLIVIHQDTVTGMLLAGVGDKSEKNGCNYFVVDKGLLLSFFCNYIDTKVKEIEDAFLGLSKRNDIGIIIINQSVTTWLLNDCLDC